MHRIIIKQCFNLSNLNANFIITIIHLLVVTVDWRQCGNNLAFCYFAVVMELPNSLWMNCKSEFDVIF